MSITPFLGSSSFLVATTPRSAPSPPGRAPWPGRRGASATARAGGRPPGGPGRAAGRVVRSDVPRTKAVARTVREEREGIPNWFPRDATNAIPEGPGSVARSVKGASGGFGDLARLEAMASLRLGRLDFSARLASECAGHQK